ncbi:MAG: acetate uptake transporter, partial [Bacteroidia bacterium]|nr:acetate uptake transporter [Bacteroidia bacterium]
PRTAMGADLKSSENAMGWYLLLWGIFTGCMFIGTLKLNLTLQIVFSSLTVLFVLLAVSDFTGTKDLKVVAGIEGIFCGLSAIYACVAQILNEVYKRQVLPL